MKYVIKSQTLTILCPKKPCIDIAVDANTIIRSMKIVHPPHIMKAITEMTAF